MAEAVVSLIDKAHEESDNILKQTNKELNKQYNEAYKEAKAILSYELSKIDLSHDSAQMRFVALNKKLDDIVEKVAVVLSQANKTAKKDINTMAVTIYKTNYNFMAETLNYKEVNQSESKQAYEEVDFFNGLALENLTDKEVLKRELKSKITQAVISNKGTHDVFKALKSESETLLKDCVRIASTTTTMMECKGRFDIATTAEQHGHLLMKVWRSIGDNKTRPAHRKANGQKRKLDEPFEVDGEYLMYPGDWSLGASVGNTINCRCTMAVIEY